MKQISVKVHELIKAIAFRASDEFLTFLYSRDVIVDLYDDLQACRKRLDLRGFSILAVRIFPMTLQSSAGTAV
jgi:hypothetical protein